MQGPGSYMYRTARMEGTGEHPTDKGRARGFTCVKYGRRAYMYRINPNQIQISSPLAAGASSPSVESSLPKRLPAPLILMKTDNKAEAMMMMPRLR